MIKKVIGLLIVSCSLWVETAFAKMPFLPPTKIKAEMWKAELSWTDDIVSKITLAQSNHANKAKVIKGKQRKGTEEFAKLLEQKEPSKSEIENFSKNMAELEKSQWENDLEFVLQVKKILKPDQQKQLMAKMSERKMKAKKDKEDENE